MGSEKLEEEVTIDKVMEGIGNLMEGSELEDMNELGLMILQQVMAKGRSVFTPWDGNICASSYAIMQQGIVIHVDEPANAAWSSLPAETLESWQTGYKLADVTVSVDADTVADNAAIKIIEDTLDFIQKNPPLSKQWKNKADMEPAKQDKLKAVQQDAAKLLDETDNIPAAMTIAPWFNKKEKEERKKEPVQKKMYKKSEIPKVLGGLSVDRNKKLVVITGASSGLGLWCTKALTARGDYYVVAAVRDTAKMEQKAKEIGIP